MGNAAKGTFFDKLFKGLYNLKRKDGSYYANDALQQRQYENYLNNNEGYQNISNLDDNTKDDFMRNHNLNNEADLQNYFLKDQYDSLDEAAEAERAGIAGGVGAWEEGANRDMSKQIMRDWISENKLKTLGYGMGGAMNLAGLTDNDKFGGQLLGAGLGGALGAQGLGFTQYGSVPLALAGGAIGSLFDKLRAKRAQESQYPQYR